MPHENLNKPTRAALFETFNARNLSPEQVARYFIMPPEFEHLCGSRHSVLMGPRGSGKTTLLKMLTPRALAAWEGPEADILRDEIGFIAIYVPTDIHWYHQLFHKRYLFGKKPILEQAFEECAITTNILLACCEAIEAELHRRGTFNEKAAVELARLMLKNWQLSGHLPLFGAVREALAARINELHVRTNLASREETDDRSVRRLPEFVALDYLPAINTVLLAFERLFRGGEPQKWALCFDELELAPAWFQDRLFTELRSTDQKFFFKLSTSPLPKLEWLHASMPREDFAVIRLWPTSDTSSDFSERLFKSVAERHVRGTVSLTQLLGHSPFSEAGGNDYSRSGDTWMMFKDLASLDDSFASLLRSKGISPEDPFTEDTTLRDRVLRKAKPIAIQRWFYLKRSKDGRTVQRSRKHPALYYGKEIFMEITDGNPRWLTGLANELFRKVKIGRRGKPLRFSKNIQSNILHSVSDQFATFLEAVPWPRGNAGEPPRNLLPLVDEIGKYFYRQIVMGRFSLDPIGSFRVQTETPELIQRFIRLAAYHGALILVPKKEFETEMEARFRLTFLLAPRMKLPIRLYKSVNLTEILQGRIEVEDGDH